MYTVQWKANGVSHIEHRETALSALWFAVTVAEFSGDSDMPVVFDLIVCRNSVPLMHHATLFDLMDTTLLMDEIEKEKAFNAALEGKL